MSDKKMWARGLGGAVRDYKTYKAMFSEYPSLVQYFQGRLMGFLSAGLWLSFITEDAHKKAGNFLLEVIK